VQSSSQIVTTNKPIYSNKTDPASQSMALPHTGKSSVIKFVDVDRDPDEFKNLLATSLS